MLERHTEQSVKLCCSTFYGSDFARFLLGDSFHPGGTELTGELGQRLELSPSSSVLDVACGRGTSAFYLAERFGCRVTGIDLSSENIFRAREDASSRGLTERLHFEAGDAESLAFDAASFDAIICECAFCTFPDKAEAADEFYRVLKPGGFVGMTDLTRAAIVSTGLDGLLSWIACIGDAKLLEQYAQWLTGARFTICQMVDRSECLREMVQQIRSKTMAAEIMVGLKKLALPGVDFGQAKDFLKLASQAVERQELGYGLLIARK